MENENYIGASTEDFLEYFKSNIPNDMEEKLLLLNFYSPNHTITSTTLAMAMGWKNFNSANLHYGGYAGRVAEEMRFEPPTDESISFFCEFEKPESGKDEGQWQWILRPELVEAVKQLGLDTKGAKETAERALSHAELMLMR